MGKRSKKAFERLQELDCESGTLPEQGVHEACTAGLRSWFRFRCFSAIGLTLLLLICGCAHKKPKNTAPPPAFVSVDKTSNSKIIITPDDGLVGKVAMVNQSFRFVILNFPVGHLPAPDQYLNLYRAGVKVGEVKVTHQQNDDNVVADVLTGDAEVGDSVRKQ